MTDDASTNPGSSASGELLREIVELAPIALLVTDTTGCIQLFNREAERLFGYAREELLGQPIERLVPAASRAHHATSRDGYLAQPYSRQMGKGRQLYAQRKDGSLIPVEIALKPLQLGSGPLVLSVVVDISERQHLETQVMQANADLERRVHERTLALEQANRDNQDLLRDLAAQKRSLEQLSQQDALTGLANRRAFDQRLDVEIQRCERLGLALAVAMLDLDHFKAVNDRYGHALGDAVLQTVGTLLRDNVRPFDLAARYGGEEFTLALLGSDLDDGAAACERIRRALEVFPWHTLAPGLAVTISAGVSIWRPGLTAAALLATADARLYEAKRAGRNCVRTS